MSTVGPARTRITLEHLARPRTRPPGIEVFAAEPGAVQLSWSSLPQGEWTVSAVDDHERPLRASAFLESTGGAGGLVLDDLPEDASGRIRLRSARHRHDRAWRTPAAPPGEELFRFATISDLHLGRGQKHYRGPLARPGTTEDSLHDDPELQLRCAAAALDEALAWGAQLVVVKGDVCEETTDDAWDQAARLLGALPVPVAILPGNHDTGSRRAFEPEHGAAARGLHLTRGVDHLDVPGLRLVLVDSTRTGNGWGTVDRHGPSVAQLAGEADTGVFVATHHQAQRWSVPLYWPHGIPGPDARRFAAALHRANPSSMISSGHTHRCRLRTVQRVPWTEVGATNHFPGVWGGYVVHEGGIRQTVRRINAPEVAAWAEQTRHMLHGGWALWATGTIRDRCVSFEW